MLPIHPKYPKQTALLGAIVLGGLLGALTLRPAPAQAAESTPTPDAKAAEALTQKVTTQMEKWLALSDSGKESDVIQNYAETSAFFKKHVTEAQWIAALAEVRAPLEAVRSRTLLIAKEEKTTLPPATSPGDYVIAQFATVFEKGGAMIETVTFEKEKDGQWRASGYYIKPA